MISHEVRVLIVAALYGDDLNTIPNYEGFSDSRLLKAWREHFGDARIPEPGETRRPILEDSLSE
jgi:hypothetical protein